MVPPFVITGKPVVIVTKRGYYEISPPNKIQYKVTNIITDFLELYPYEGIGVMTELPPYADIHAFDLLHTLCQGLEIEICFSLLGKRKNDLLLDFIFGEILPFTMREFEASFYQLKMLPDSIYQEFYRRSSTIEETMATTISTFDENVFIPFKQKFISAIHNRTDEKANTTIGTFSRDFPRFFKLHQDLLTILLSQAQQVSDHQHLSFSIFAPILRKIRMLNTMKDNFKIKERKNHIELKIEPMKLDSAEIAAQIAPLVEVK